MTLRVELKTSAFNGFNEVGPVAGDRGGEGRNRDRISHRKAGRCRDEIPRPRPGMARRVKTHEFQTTWRLWRMVCRPRRTCEACGRQRQKRPKLTQTDKKNICRTCFGVLRFSELVAALGRNPARLNLAFVGRRIGVPTLGAKP